MEKKILLIWDRLGEYHLARWEALKKLGGEENVFVAALGRGDNLYKWGEVNKKVGLYQLSEKQVQEFDLIKRLTGFLRILRNENIDTLVISGYGKMEYLFFIFLGRFFGRKIILFAESWYQGNVLLDRLKGLFLNLFINGFFVSGIRAEEHFHKRLGISLKKIEKGYSAVDNEHFTPLEGLSKRQLSKNPTFQDYLLCVARYSPEKNLVFLIKAYRSSHLYKKWKLVIIGDGPMKEELIHFIGEDKEWIVLTGWKSYEELPIWYAKAKCFILPSTFEPWGLVINEAMASGLPIMVSQNCGCVPDLISVDNGWVFYADNNQTLTVLLNKLANMDEENLQKFGTKSMRIIKKFSLISWAKKLIGLSY